MAYTDKDRERFIEILAKNVGNVAGACRAMNINRRTYYNWMEKHEEFKLTVEDITEALIDDAESGLQKLIKDGKYDDLKASIKKDKEDKAKGGLNTDGSNYNG